MTLGDISFVEESPASFEVSSGFLIDEFSFGQPAVATIDEVTASDDDRLHVAAAVSSKPSDSIVVFTGESPFVDPVGLVVPLEASVGKMVSAIQLIEMLDVTTQQWEAIDSRLAEMQDATLVLEVATPSRFIDPSDQNSKTRIRFLAAPGTRFTSAIDFFSWAMRGRLRPSSLIVQIRNSHLPNQS